MFLWKKKLCCFKRVLNFVLIRRRQRQSQETQKGKKKKEEKVFISEMLKNPFLQHSEQSN